MSSLLSKVNSDLRLADVPLLATSATYEGEGGSTRMTSETIPSFTDTTAHVIAAVISGIGVATTGA